MGRLGIVLELSAIVVGCCIDSAAHAAAYRAMLLHPPDYSLSVGADNSNGIQVGNGRATSVSTHALLWSNSANSVVDLHPAGFTRSYADAVFGDSQIGSGDTVGGSHALLWHGTAESVVDLHPVGFVGSLGKDVWDDRQVGGGHLGGRGPWNALLWSGTSESAVNLHPVGYTSSSASGIWDNKQVGHGEVGAVSHALMWGGTAESVIDLHPEGFYRSLAFAVSGNSQVGIGSTTGLEWHALLWKGSAESVVDLNPPGFSLSRAEDVAGGRQVGFGYGPATGGEYIHHALAWTGTAASAVDLHPFLSDLGIDFIESMAHGIAENGVVIGHASDETRSYAILWLPIPEPATLALALFGLSMMPVHRMRARRRN